MQKTNHTKRSKWDKSGPDKYEEEIVKWREMSYAHAFARLDYDDVANIPQWALSCLNNHRSGIRGHALQQLANGTTGDTKWDAMQQYLVRTGELHNNGRSCYSFYKYMLCLLAATNLTQLYTVRMTWGKTVVEWIGCSDQSSSDLSSAQVTLRTLCYLNDRYALDALSPPSYAGLLWCTGWTDKPNGNGDWRIPLKPASRYKMSAEQFRLAEQKLLSNVQTGVVEGGSAVTTSSGIKRQPSLLDMMRAQPNTSSSDTIQTQTKPKANNSGAKRKRSVLDLMKSHASGKSSDT